MEKRRTERINICLDAALVSGGINCAGLTRNFSDDGLCIVTAPTDLIIFFSAGTLLELKLKLLSGETLNLQCRLAWATNALVNGKSYSIGVEVINPPSEYKRLYRAVAEGKLVEH